ARRAAAPSRRAVARVAVGTVALLVQSVVVAPVARSVPVPVPSVEGAAAWPPVAPAGSAAGGPPGVWQKKAPVVASGGPPAARRACPARGAIAGARAPALGFAAAAASCAREQRRPRTAWPAPPARATR